jgi:hypothetical protein
MKTETLQESKKPKSKWIFFQGTQPKPGEFMQKHGLYIEKGTVQKVSQSVFDYLVAMRGFTEVLQVKDDIMDFPKSKRIRKTK